MCSVYRCVHLVTKWFTYFCILVSCLLVGCGVYLHRIKITEGPIVTTLANIALISGLVLFILSFFGYCAVRSENYCMLMTYGVLLGVMFFTGFCYGVWMKWNHSQLIDDIEQLFTNYENDEGNKRMFHEIQESFECCGLDGHGDYVKLLGNDTLPRSCCERVTKWPCSPGGDYFKLGCVDKLSVLNVEGNVMIAISFLNFIASAFTFYLGLSVKDRPETITPV